MLALLHDHTQEGGRSGGLTSEYKGKTWYFYMDTCKRSIICDLY